MYMKAKRVVSFCLLDC